MKKIVAMLSLLVMLFSLQPNVLATPQGINEPKQLSEIESLRSANTKAYQLENGLIEYDVYQSNIHYKDKNGLWKDIDTTIHDANATLALEGYKYMNGDNNWSTYFSEQNSKTDMVKISYKDKTLGFSIQSSSKCSVLEKSSLSQYGNSSIYNNLHNDNSAVLYRNISQNVDLSYQIGEDYLKESIILNSMPTEKEFIFDLNMKGLIPEQRENSIYFIDEISREILFTTGELFAEDSSGKYSSNLKIQLVKKSDKYQIKIIPDSLFLTQPDIQYPIVIDPTIYFVQGSSTTFDSFVGSLSPNQNYNSGANLPYLRTGYDSSYAIRRTYMKFTLPSISGSVIHSYIKLKKYSQGTVNPSLHAYRVTSAWDSSTITWNNKPAYNTTYGSSSATYVGNDWYRMEVTDLVSRWYNLTYTNYGFCIRDDTENNSNDWATWYSSDNSNALAKPRLIIITSFSPHALCVGRNLQPNDADFYSGVYNAWNFLFNNYDADLLQSSSASTVRSLLSENACVIVSGHGYGGGIQVYDSSGTVTTLTANNDGYSDHASLEYLCSSGSTTLDGIRLIVYLGCHTGQTSAMSGNFLARSKEYGADCAVGFTDEIYIGDTWSAAWSIYFYGHLCDGYNVGSALDYAKFKVYNENGSYGGYDTYVYDGDVSYPAGVTISPAQYGN